MTRRIRTSSRAAVAVAVAALALGAAGLAYFTATGSGSAPGYVANLQSLTLSSASPTGSALFPGGSTDVAATVNNPNSVSVHVHAFALDTSQADDGIAIDAPGCSRGSVTFNGPATNGGNDFVFPPGDTALTLANALSMSNTAENACQGATFTVYLQVSS